MNSLKLIMLAVLVLTIAGLGQAATIALVSDAYAPGDPTEGVVHNDDTLVSFLQGLGYTVDTAGMGEAYKEGNAPFTAGSASLAALQSADLVIVSRRTSSGGYDNDRNAWNGLETPLILVSGYLTRGETSSKKWGWTTGGSGNAGDGTVTDLDGTTQSMFDWTEAPIPGTNPKSVYLPNSSGEVVAGGTVLAEFAGKPFLIEYAAGTDFDTPNGTVGKYGIAGADRMFIGHWGYDDGITGTNGSDGGPSDWADYLTDEYKALFADSIASMIPEPATLVLLGLGGLLLRKRR